MAPVSGSLFVVVDIVCPVGPVFTLGILNEVLINVLKEKELPVIFVDKSLSKTQF